MTSLRPDRPPTRLLPILAIVAAGIFAYHDGFDGVFLYDDEKWIVFNQDLRVLWPPWVPMGPSFRVFSFYSWAINYAISGLQTWSYHALSLGLHLATALVLRALVVEALTAPRVAMEERRARTIALATALLWIVHPLNSQAVMYIIQRAEILVSLAYVSALYCYLRALRTEDSRRRRRWVLATFGAFVFGLGCKEIAVTIPVALYVADVLLVEGSLREPLRRRRGIYAALFGPLLAAPLLLFLFDPHRFAILRPHETTPPVWRYLTSQGGVVLEYLRLLAWPIGLNLDHAWHPEDHTATVIAGGVLVGSVLVATIVGVARRSPFAFPSALFFVVLALSSSFLPLHDYMVEHRMYLASACVLFGIVLVGDSLVRRFAAESPLRRAVAAGTLVAATSALAAVTVARTNDYRSRVAMWQDVIDKAPHNPRGHFNLGQALRDERGNAEAERALAHFLRAAELQPHHRGAHTNAGALLYLSGDLDRAEHHLGIAASFRKPTFDCLSNLAAVLLERERYAQADVILRRALDETSREPEMRVRAPALHNNLGHCAMRLGRLDDAIEQFEHVTSIAPDWPRGYANLGRALAASGRHDEAIAALRRAVELQPSSMDARIELARVQTAAGRHGNAVATYFETLSHDPASIDVQVDLAVLCSTTDAVDVVEGALRSVLAADPQNPTARQCLRVLLAQR